VEERRFQRRVERVDRFGLQAQWSSSSWPTDFAAFCFSRTAIRRAANASPAPDVTKVLSLPVLFIPHHINEN
jgi:hypothetical protein